MCLVILLVLEVEHAMVRLTSYFLISIPSMTERTSPKYIFLQGVPREFREEAPKEVPDVAFEEVPEESSSVYFPKALSKASSSASIRFLASCIISFSVALCFE
jgi:hypothetical protein